MMAMAVVHDAAVAATAATTLAAVTHALTLRGAQLMHARLSGAKRVENRHFRLQPGWYALHTGAKTSAHESQHALLAAVPGMLAEADLPHGAIVGAIRISHALTLEQCEGEPWAFGPVCNVVDAIARLETPVAHKGALSVWRIGTETLAEVQAQLARATVFENDVSHLPGKDAAPKAFNVRKAGSGAGSGGRSMLRRHTAKHVITWRCALRDERLDLLKVAAGDVLVIIIHQSHGMRAALQRQRRLQSMRGERERSRGGSPDRDDVSSTSLTHACTQRKLCWAMMVRAAPSYPICRSRDPLS